MSIRTLNGIYLFATNNYIKTLALANCERVSNIIGMGYEFFTNIGVPQNAIDFQLKFICDLMLKQSQRIDSISTIRTEGLSLVINLPIFNQYKRCFAVKSISRPLTDVVASSELITVRLRRYNCPGIILSNVFGVKMDEREEIILSLLLMQKSQKEIAAALNTSRSNIAKIIGQICIKFEVNGYSSKTLIDKAIHLGYSNWIPYNLLFFRETYNYENN